MGLRQTVYKMLGGGGTGLTVRCPTEKVLLTLSCFHKSLKQTNKQTKKGHRSRIDKQEEIKGTKSINY